MGIGMNLDEIRRQNMARYIEQHFNNNRSEFARRVGKSPSYINGVLMPQNPRNMTGTTVRGIESALGLPAGLWDNANAEPIAPSSNVRTTSSPINSYACTDELDNSQFALIPKNTLRLSAGPGYEVISVENDTPIALSHSYLKRRGIKPEYAEVWQIDGNSMLPRLQDGDEVLVDAHRQTLQNDKIFAIIFKNDLYIKRIQKNANGNITLRSDNPDYQAADIEIDYENLSELKIIGQVIDLIGGRIL